MSDRKRTPSISAESRLGSFRGSNSDISRRAALLSEEERQQQAMARQREIALLLRSFTSPGGGIATSQTSLLGG